MLMHGHRPQESCNSKTYISQNASVTSPEKCWAWHVVRGCHEAGWWSVFMRARRGPGLLILGDQEHSWIRSCLLGWWNPPVICHSSNMESHLYPCRRPQDMLVAFQHKDKCCLYRTWEAVHICVFAYVWTGVICFRGLEWNRTCAVCWQHQTKVTFYVSGTTLALINLSEGGRIWITPWIFHHAEVSRVDPGGGWILRFCVCISGWIYMLYFWKC